MELQLQMFVLCGLLWSGTRGQSDGEFQNEHKDRCCEKIRVHYNQRAVYQILNIPHDELKAGINCKQKVCPSQFPAFYRVMYVGGLPGTSVSFAVCTGDESVPDSSANESSNQRRRRGLNNTNIPIGSSSEKHNAKSNRTAEPNRYQKDFRVPKMPGLNLTYNKLLRQFSGGNLRRSRWTRAVTNGRTVFEIPQPHSSVVYTLTGVCFCLTVTSKPDEAGPLRSQATPSVRKMRSSSDVSATSIKDELKTNEALLPNVIPKAVMFQETQTTTSTLLAPSSSHNSTYLSQLIHGRLFHQSKTGFGQTQPIRRERRSLLDSFIGSVLSQGRTATTTTTESAITTDPLTIATPPKEPSLLRETPQPTPADKSVPKGPINVNPVINNIVKNQDYPKPAASDNNENNNRGPEYDDFNSDNNDSQGHDNVVDNKDKEEEKDEDGEKDEYDDKLIVFASFSHDVHFIGSISMVVSVAASCRSNTPLEPEAQTPYDGEVDVNTTKAHNNNVVSTARSARSTDFQEGSSWPSPSDESVSLNLTNITGIITKNVSSLSDDEDNDNSSILVWQASLGGVVGILLVVVVAMMVVVLRQKRRIQDNYYFIAREVESRNHNINQNVDSARNTSNTSGSAETTTNSIRNNQEGSNDVAPKTDGMKNKDGNAIRKSVPIAIPRTIQAVPRQDNDAGPVTTVNVGSVYPMHMRLRSLSAAAEVARLRGNSALRMLNNSGRRGSTGDQTTSTGSDGEDTGRTSLKVVPAKTITDSQRVNAAPAVAVQRREFDLGEFALYRNDIMLKLRGFGLRTGRRRKRVKTDAGKTQAYDNMDFDGQEVQDSDYSSYYGGGESEI